MKYDDYIKPEGFDIYNLPMTEWGAFGLNEAKSDWTAKCKRDYFGNRVHVCSDACATDLAGVWHACVINGGLAKALNDEGAPVLTVADFKDPEAQGTITMNKATIEKLAFCYAWATLNLRRRNCDPYTFPEAYDKLDDSQDFRTYVALRGFEFFKTPKALVTLPTSRPGYEKLAKKIASTFITWIEKLYVTPISENYEHLHKALIKVYFPLLRELGYDINPDGTKRQATLISEEQTAPVIEEKADETPVVTPIEKTEETTPEPVKVEEPAPAEKTVQKVKKPSWRDDYFTTEDFNGIGTALTLFVTNKGMKKAERRLVNRLLCFLGLRISISDRENALKVLKDQLEILHTEIKAAAGGVAIKIPLTPEDAPVLTQGLN